MCSAEQSLLCEECFLLSRMSKRPFFCPQGHLMSLMSKFNDDIIDLKLACSGQKCRDSKAVSGDSRLDLYRCGKCEYNLCQTCYYDKNSKL